MSRPNQSRRAAVVLKSGVGQTALATIGNRSLHQYWALLKTHFRGVLLAPQSLSDGASTQWTWREPVDGPPLTATELATVRKRLAGAQRALADSAEDASDSATAEPRRTGSVLSQLQAHMDAVVTALTSHPDATLATYVVRSEQGLLLHSWGLPAALTPHFPDQAHCEIVGTVFVAGTPAPDREVLLENPDDATLDRTRSDGAGKFRFSKISPGHYRARAVSDRDSFPAEGVMVEIDRTSVTGLELRDRGDDQAAGATEAPPRRRSVLPFILLGSLAIVVACVGWWRSADSSSSPIATAKSAEANVASEAFARSHPERSEPAPSPIPSAADAAPLRPKTKTASAEQPPTRAPKKEPPARESKRSPAVVAVEQRVSGLGTAASSAPAAAASPSSTAAAPAGTAGNAGAVSSGTGVSVSGTSSPTAGASASSISSAGMSASQNAAASPSAATASPPPSPATPPPTPPPIAASTPAPSPSPSNQSEPPQTSASTSAALAVTKTAAASTEISAVAASNSDSSGDKSPSPDPPDSPSDDRPPDRSPLSDLSTTTSSSVSTSDEPESTPPRTNSLPSDRRADSISTARDTKQPFRLRIRVAGWQPRLLQDLILPTGPTRIGDDDAFEALRERLFRERRAQIPLLLKQPVARIGFVIELPTEVSGSHSAHWRDTENSAATRATVVARHAEISWPSNPPPGATSTLLADDGRELARITADERGRLTLVAIAGVRAWPWIGIERPLADDARGTAAEWTARLEWRVLSGAPAAPTWQRDDHWLKDHGHRLDLALGARTGGPASHALALVDRVTGWAIVSDIEQAQELPETTVSLSR